MCGLAGFYGRFDRARLQAMTAALAHRGPDGEGIELVRDGGDGCAAGLGHRRLAIIDLAGGAQPMWSGDERAAIVFNGEIYNYRELRQRLIAEGRRFATQSDTEIILEGWRAWGGRIVDELEGMFAFAIWDADRRAWFLARDRFGIKPLYYCRPSSDSIAFASEVKPLLPLIGGARTNRAALYDYLLHGWSATAETIFAGVHQLPPGHTLLWQASDGSGDPIRYWRLKRQETPRSEAEWVEAIRAKLDAAVASHLIADVPVGLTLSGGLDSSTVLAAMARQMPPGQIQAYCIGFGLPDDELPFARLAASRCGVTLHERIAAPDTFAANFARNLWHLEEPIAHPMIETTFQLARFVREGLKVIQIGEGSDELFAGYPQHKLFRAPYSLAPRSRLRDAFIAVSCLMPTARTLTGLLARDACERDLLQHMERRFDPYFEHGSIADGALQFELETELPYNQLARIDKLTMAHSVEARVPFLDRAFAELAHSAPYALKFGAGVQKRLLRLAMQDRLPAEILHRPKSGKGGTQALLPTIHAMVRTGELSALIDREAIGRRGWFDPDAVGRYLDGADRWWVSRHPIESRRRAKFALALAALEQWARLFLDGEQPWTV